MRIGITTLIGFLCVTCQLFAQNDDQRTIRIPVVFHVLYADSAADGSNPQTGNNSQYIPTSKLLKELQDLHDDFLLLNADTSIVNTKYKGRIGNPNIEFYLADTLLQKRGEKGIIRIRTKRNKYSQMTKTSAPINPHRYLNVYIGRLRSGSGTTLPPREDTSAIYEDDVIKLDYAWVGLDYRLLTHEAGHWLGLEHVFGGDGDGSGNKQSCSEGDNIADTHPQKNPTDSKCDKCPPNIKDQSCDDQPSNYNNYMDYSGCRTMFTVEQSKTMRDIVMKRRPWLWRSSLN